MEQLDLDLWVRSLTTICSKDMVFIPLPVIFWLTAGPRATVNTKGKQGGVFGATGGWNLVWIQSLMPSMWIPSTQPLPKVDFGVRYRSKC
jgi:hypothetical protein